ncbi:MAG: DUF4465 domain-containing protein [Bacteroides sp.]
MRKQFRFLAMFAVTSTALVVSSCSQEDDYLINDAIQHSQTRTHTDGEYTVIDFENDPSILLAGPTSYGENLYAAYSDAKFTSWTSTLPRGKTCTFGLNSINGAFNFYNGGIAISNWNIMSNPAGKTGDWWYSYLNQCSVYNTASVDAANQGAGHGNSNNFGIMYGYSDDFNASYMANAQFYFSPGTQYIIQKMHICNSSYTYGVMKYGNQFGASGSAVSLEEAKGYFKVLAYGFDANGNATNGGRPVEKYLADYRIGTTPIIAISTQWIEWDLSALGAVNKVKFNFVGSDSGAYGLNTPAYLCIDDIYLH